jgi:outer membrane protein assembly factor BamB
VPVAIRVAIVAGVMASAAVGNEIEDAIANVGAAAEREAPEAGAAAGLAVPDDGTVAVTNAAEDLAEVGTVEVMQPKGGFGRWILTLNQGFVDTNLPSAALIVHLPFRDNLFKPEGWCVEPGANIIGVVDARALRREGDRIAGSFSIFPWEPGVSRVYEMTGTVDGAAVSGEFTLRQTGLGAAAPSVVRDRFAGKAIPEPDLARGNELTPGKQFPMWRGPNGSGNSDSGRRLVLSPANARLAWLSEDIIPNAAWNNWSKGLSGGCDNVCVEDGRVYLVYYVPSGNVRAKNIDFNKPLPEYTKEKWRLHWLVEADDVIHCFDARTGATLWKTTFKRTGLNTNAREPGLKGTPHRTVCVADGKAFAVGSAGHLFCVDAATGKEIWRSALPRARKIGDEVRQRSIADRQVCGMSIVNGHPVYAEGMLVCADTGGSDSGKRAPAFVQGFEAATGKHVWTYGLEQGFYMLGTSSSVNRWTHQGRAWIVAAGTTGAVCLDPKTGKVVWRREDALHSGTTTVALGEDHMVTAGMGDDLRRIEWEGGSFAAEFKKTPMRCYRLSLEGPTLLWELSGIGFAGHCVPLIRDGHLFLKASGAVSIDCRVEATGFRLASIVCVSLATGKIVATVREVPACESESYVGGDGIGAHGWGLGQMGFNIFHADPQDLRLLSPLPLPRKYYYYGWCSTPAYADGRLFLRSWDRLACYDLRMDERVVKAGEAMERGDSATALRLFSDACRDFEAAVRREGIAGLSRMGGQAESAFGLLVELARDDIASSVRAAAVGALGPVMRARPERLIELLEKADHPRARAAAAVALGAFDVSDPRIVPAQTRALGDGDPAVRLAAIRALAGWKQGAAPAAAVLAVAIRDRDKTEAALAVEALKGIGGEGAAAAAILVEALVGDSDERSGWAATALAAIGKPATSELARRVRDANPRTAVRCMRVLGGMKTTAADAAPVLSEALREKEWPRAAAAASALAAVDETREPLVVSALAERLSGSDANVAVECAMALAGLFADAKRDTTRQDIVGVLSKELRTRMGTSGLMAKNMDRAVAAGLLRALGAIGPAAKSAAPVLKKALDDTLLGGVAADAWRRIMPGQPLPKPELDAGVELE